SYSWDNDPSLSCLNCPDPIAKPAGPTTYRVTGTDADGCSLTDSILISFHPTPVLNLGGDREVCIEDTLNLRATGGLSYQWSPATGLSCTNCDAPVASPTTTTTYSVVGTFTGGCIDSGKVTVTVNPLPEIETIADTAICLGESVLLK